MILGFVHSLVEMLVNAAVNNAATWVQFLPTLKLKHSCRVNCRVGYVHPNIRLVTRAVFGSMAHVYLGHHG